MYQSLLPPATNKNSHFPIAPRHLYTTTGHGEGPRGFQVFDITLGFPPELYNKTLWLKMPLILDEGHREIDLEERWKLLCWLASMCQKELYTGSWREKHPWSQAAVNPTVLTYLVMSCPLVKWLHDIKGENNPFLNWSWGLLQGKECMPVTEKGLRPYRRAHCCLAKLTWS